MLGNARVPNLFPIVYCSDGFCDLSGYPRLMKLCDIYLHECSDDLIQFKILPQIEVYGRFDYLGEPKSFSQIFVLLIWLDLILIFIDQKIFVTPLQTVRNNASLNNRVIESK